MAATLQNFFASLMIGQAFVFPLKGQEIIYGSNNGKYVEVSGRDIYYEAYGEGEPVLLLHGGAGSIANFSNLIPRLSNFENLPLVQCCSIGHSEWGS